MTNNNINNVLLCSVIGTILEWYDFFLFGALSSIMAEKFFAHNDIPPLISSFGVFAIGYLARPFGSIFWGHIGDTIGRKKTLLYSIALMTASTISIGFLPSYETIGLYAPLLLIVLRIMQGFSVSGEHTGCLLMVGESIQNHKNDFYLSFCLSSIYIGILMANLFSFSLAYFLGQQLFIDWGWRITFIIGAFLGIISYYLRRNTEETLSFKNIIKNNEHIKMPFLYLIRNNLVTVLLGAGVFQLAVSIPYVIFIFLPSYFKGNLSFFSNSISLIMVSVLIIIFGLISNDKTRKKILISSAVLVVAFSIPILNRLQNARYLHLFISQIVFSILCAAYVGAVGRYMINLFPINVRYSGIAASLNLAAIFFGGGTPLILSILTHKTNNINYIGYFLVLSSIIAIFSLLLNVKNKYESNTRFAEYRAN